jgi:hypothetical protein
MEMRVVLRRILERTELEPAAKDPDKVEFRLITLAPREGVRVVQPRRPVSAPTSSRGDGLPDPQETSATPV